MKKILLTIVALLVASNAFGATQLKKTVKPSGGDYTSLAACITAQAQNLVTADKWLDVEIDGSWSSADTTSVNVTGYTTDATHYINIYTTATARHNGTANKIRAYQLKTTGIGISMASVPVFITIDGLNIISGGNSIEMSSWGSAATATVKNNVLSGTGAASAGISSYNSSTSTFYVANNIIYGFTSASATGIFAEGTVYAYNNTLYGNYDGYFRSAGTSVLKNNISYNNSHLDYSGTFSASSTNNLSKDTTAPAYNTYYVSKTLTFVNTTAPVTDLAPHNMTTNSLPVPYVASASSEYSASYAAYKAFDGSTSAYLIMTASTGWVEIDLGSAPYIVLSYGLRANNVPEPARSPKNWTLQGSNDNSSWNTVSTVTGETSWGSGELRTYICSVITTAYRYYKLDVTLNNGDASYTDVCELYLYPQGNGYNFLLASTDTDAIDKGADLHADANYPFATDIIGTSRPQGLAFDIGASEWVSGTPVRLHKVIAPAGQGGDYTSLSACMTANAQDLASANLYFDAEISGDWTGAPDTTNVGIASYLCNSAHYINIYTSGTARHNGTAYKATAYTLQGAANTTTSIIVGNNVTYVTLDGLVINGATLAKSAIDTNAGTSSDYITIKNCIAYNNTHATATFYLKSGAQNCLIYNCMIFNVTRGIYGVGSASASTVAYNCTVKAGASGNYGIIYVTAINCFSADFSSYCYFALGATSDYLVASDTSSNGVAHYATGKTSYSSYFVGVSGGSEDLHLKDHTSTLWGLAGASQSGVFTTDIDGTTRSAWDIGADEYVSAGASGGTMTTNRGMWGT